MKNYKYKKKLWDSAGIFKTKPTTSENKKRNINKIFYA